MKNPFQRSVRVDPNELDKQTAAVNAMIEREGPRMHAVATYLERRKNQNGFGTDFEYTLKPRRA